MNSKEETTNTKICKFGFLQILYGVFLLASLIFFTGCNIQEQDLVDALGAKQEVPEQPLPLDIIPNFKQIFISAQTQFAAKGGQQPYSWSIASGPGAIDADGLFTAPASPGNAIVQVTDAKGETAEALVVIDEELVISPNNKKMNVDESFQFNVSGGTPPYSYAITAGSGTLTQTGLYTSPSTAGLATIQVTDNKGTIVTAQVDHGAGPVISPKDSAIPISKTVQLSTATGTGPFTWEVVQGLGSINASGLYTASSSPGKAIIRVTDSNGYLNETSVTAFIPNKVAAGHYSSCAWIGDSDEVKCWGQNRYGDLGQGNARVGDDPSDMGDNLRSAMLPEGFEPNQIDLSRLGACATNASGMAYCWGYSGYGQNGFNTWQDNTAFGTMGDKLIPVPVGSGYTIKEIIGGHNFNCAILNDDNVKCWGENTYGQLGQDDTNRYGSNQTTLGLDSMPVINLGQTVKKVAAGLHHTCAILADDSVKCWGLNNYGQLGIDNNTTLGDAPGEMATVPNVILGSTALDISAGYYHSCAILANGNVKCWGYNNAGQLGQGNTATYGDAPGEMASLTEISMGVGRTATQLCSGIYYNCALLDNGQMKCWGHNNYGQLGYEDNVNRGDNAGEILALSYVPLGTGRSATKIACAGYSTCAQLDNGELKCWGYNEFSQLGQGHQNNIGLNVGDMGDALPGINFPAGSTLIDFDISDEYNTCAILEIGGNKASYCWGNGIHGTAGTEHHSIGSRSGSMGSNLPVTDLGNVPGKVSKLMQGYLHGCALYDDGKAKCWGYNGYRLLGFNSPVSYIGDNPGEMGDALPYVNPGSGRTIVDMDISINHANACAILDDGALKCWGYGGYGQLGQDTTGSLYYIPTIAPVDLGGRLATQVSLGYLYACARLTDGNIRCWGYNNYGQLGQGHTNTMGDAPGEMAALTDVPLGTGRTAKSVCAGYSVACAHLDNDKVKCWGQGHYALGIETYALHRGDEPGEMGDALPYVDLGTGRTVKKLSCGVHYNCALLDNDRVKCWGYNPYGALGIESNYTKGTTPGSMGDALPYIKVGTGRTVLDVSAGYYHTCVVLDNNEVKCFGYNHFGQVGQEKGNYSIGTLPGELGDNLPGIKLK